MNAVGKGEARRSKLAHGELGLSAVEVLAYNSELRDKDGLIGDRASKRAFQAMLEQARQELKANGRDPLGNRPTQDLGKRALDRILTKGEPEAAALVMGTVEQFAAELATLVRKLLRSSGWRGVERIAIGGGMRASRVGLLAIARAGLLLRASGHAVELRPIRHHPDEAGLIGAAQLVPRWMLSGHDCMLAVDIGGTNIRTGLVELNLGRRSSLCDVRVMGLELWRHRDDEPTRDQAIDHLCRMLTDLTRRAARDTLWLVPLIGIGCPGLLEEDGTITRGAQNLPGNWEGSRFSLTERITAALPQIDGHATTVVLHNDAVVQGLSEVPWMQDVTRRGVLTIGTGLGNACFQNRPAT